jgi:hypothetical protein
MLLSCYRTPPLSLIDTFFIAFVYYFQAELAYQINQGRTVMTIALSKAIMANFYALIMMFPAI